MTLKEFFAKITSKIIWINLTAMFLVLVAIAIGIWKGLEVYTHHGEEITVPNVKGMRINDARNQLRQKGLQAVVVDSSYNRTLPSGTVLAQKPMNGKRVKRGREIELVINTTRTPTTAIPNIADNSSLREAQAKLTALGFKLGPNEYIDGEKDWVYGVKCQGRNVFSGDRVPIDATIVLQVGSGNFENDFIEEIDGDSALFDAENEPTTDAGTENGLDIEL